MTDSRTRWSGSLLMGVGLLAGSACGIDAPVVGDGDHTRAGQLVSAPAPARGRVIGGEKALRVVAWPEDDRADRVALARYSPDVRETLARAPVPVLAPADPTDHVTATVGPHWYALTVHGEGYFVSTHGSGEARVHPHVRSADPSHPMRVAGGFLTRNEDIWSASWLEHGAAYSLEIECDRRKVGWCDDEAEVLRRIEALVYVGTKPATLTKVGAR